MSGEDLQVSVFSYVQNFFIYTYVADPTVHQVEAWAS